MAENNKSAHTLLSKLIPDLVNNPIEFTPENQFAIITDPILLNDAQKSIINTLIKS